jgi:hypothetical protein
MENREVSGRIWRGRGPTSSCGANHVWGLVTVIKVQVDRNDNHNVQGTQRHPKTLHLWCRDCGSTRQVERVRYA